ncbi:MAG: efflux RND transporter periplasmic adaptor subunit [Solobacterium sp.]|nr:efflux RND transporter periplasmic adaptor subunit [Solobacterium sp.]
MKKWLKIILPIVLIVLAIGGYYIYRNWIAVGGDDGSAAYVSAVKTINAANTYTNTNNRFSGIVESQQIIDYKKSGSREIEEVYVKVGDTVAEGTPLFKYDISNSENEIASLTLDLEGLNDTLNIYRTMNDPQSQIQARMVEIDIKKKAAEIEAKRAEMENSVVNATIAGLVKAVNEEGRTADGMDAPIVQVMEMGEFRVKGKIDEQLFGTIGVGSPVLVRSRLNENQTWKGSISKIESEPNAQQNNNAYYGETGEKASSYPFYVALEHTDGLMLGQHVYVELDQMDMPNLEGIWLPLDYVVQDEEKPYVWVSENGRLKKRTVEVGAVEDMLYLIEVTSGLSDEDLIAWPEEGFHEGLKAVNMSEVTE